MLLDALPNFPENVELIVAGEFYDHASEYKVQVSKLGIENKVHFSQILFQKIKLIYSSQPAIWWFNHINLPHKVVWLKLHTILINLYWLQMLADFLKLCHTKSWLCC